MYIAQKGVKNFVTIISISPLTLERFGSIIYLAILYEGCKIVKNWHSKLSAENGG